MDKFSLYLLIFGLIVVIWSIGEDLQNERKGRVDTEYDRMYGEMQPERSDILGY